MEIKQIEYKDHEGINTLIIPKYLYKIIKKREHLPYTTFVTYTREKTGFTFVQSDVLWCEIKKL